MPKPISFQKTFFDLQDRPVGTYYSEQVDVSSIAEVVLYPSVTAGGGTLKYALEGSVDGLSWHPLKELHTGATEAVLTLADGDGPVGKFTQVGRLVRVKASVENASLAFSIKAFMKL